MSQRVELTAAEERAAERGRFALLVILIISVGGGIAIGGDPVTCSLLAIPAFLGWAFHDQIRVNRARRAAAREAAREAREDS